MRRTLVVAVGLVTLTALAVRPAEAGDTSTTFTLTAAGGLAISQPASTNLGSVATNAGTLSTQLGAVTVTDTRGALLGSWTVSVTSTDFTTGLATADEIIAKGSVDYWSGAATSTTGTVVATPGQATVLNKVTMAVSRTAFSAAAIVGNNTVAWNPTVVVNIPSDSVVGVYAGTITHSVA